MPATGFASSPACGLRGRAGPATASSIGTSSSVMAPLARMANEAASAKSRTGAMPMKTLPAKPIAVVAAVRMAGAPRCAAMNRTAAARPSPGEAASPLK